VLVHEIITGNLRSSAAYINFLTPFHAAYDQGRLTTEQIRFWDMDKIFRIDGLNVRIQQKIKVGSLLELINLILYPSQHGDRYQNHFDIMHSDLDIDERRICRNGGLNLHIGGIAQGWQGAIIQILKEHTSEVWKQQKTLHGRYCKVLQKSGVWQPDYYYLHTAEKRYTWAGKSWRARWTVVRNILLSGFI